MKAHHHLVILAVAVLWFGQAQAQYPPGLGPAPIPPDAPRPGTPGFIAWWTAHGPKRAPQGYHYETGSEIITPNDPCWRDEMASPGAVKNVNDSVGKKNGIPKPIVALVELASADSIQLASVGIQLPRFGQASVSCHVTLKFTDGGTSAGVVSINDPGQFAPLQVSWISDLDIAAARAKTDRLRTATNLYVKPNLIDPAIQACVGRATALGTGEQFPGQLWAACAASTPASAQTYEPYAKASPANKMYAQLFCDDLSAFQPRSAGKPADWQALLFGHAQDPAKINALAQDAAAESRVRALAYRWLQNSWT